jgi:hypothetical protein
MSKKNTRYQNVNDPGWKNAVSEKRNLRETFDLIYHMEGILYGVAEAF